MSVVDKRSVFSEEVCFDTIPFLPQSHELSLATLLLQKGIIDETGKVRESILSIELPALTLFESNKIIQFLKESQLLEILNSYYQDVESTGYTSELIGSVVPFLLGKDYFQRALQKLGVDLAPYETLFHELEADPTDIDIRTTFQKPFTFLRTYGSNPAKYEARFQQIVQELQKNPGIKPGWAKSLEQLKEQKQIAPDTISRLAEVVLATFSNQFTEALAQKGIARGKVTHIKQEARTHLIAHQFHLKDKKVDHVLNEKLERLHLFIKDDLRLDITRLFSTANSDLEGLIPQSDDKKEPVQGWQALIDWMLKINRIDDVESVNFRGWVRAMRDKVKGYVLAPSDVKEPLEIERILLQKLKNPAIDVKVLAKELRTSWEKHPNVDPRALQSLAMHACISLEQLEGNELAVRLWNELFATDHTLLEQTALIPTLATTQPTLALQLLQDNMRHFSKEVVVSLVKTVTVKEELSLDDLHALQGLYQDLEIEDPDLVEKITTLLIAHGDIDNAAYFVERASKDPALWDRVVLAALTSKESGLKSSILIWKRGRELGCLSENPSFLATLRSHPDFTIDDCALWLRGTESLKQIIDAKLQEAIAQNNPSTALTMLQSPYGRTLPETRQCEFKTKIIRLLLETDRKKAYETLRKCDPQQVALIPAISAHVDMLLARGDLADAASVLKIGSVQTMLGERLVDRLYALMEKGFIAVDLLQQLIEKLPNAQTVITPSFVRFVERVGARGSFSEQVTQKIEENLAQLFKKIEQQNTPQLIWELARALELRGVTFDAPSSECIIEACRRTQTGPAVAVCIAALSSYEAAQPRVFEAVLSMIPHATASELSLLLNASKRHLSTEEQLACWKRAVVQGDLDLLRSYGAALLQGDERVVFNDHDLFLQHPDLLHLTMKLFERYPPSVTAPWLALFNNVVGTKDSDLKYRAYAAWNKSTTKTAEMQGPALRCLAESGHHELFAWVTEKELITLDQKAFHLLLEYVLLRLDQNPTQHHNVLQAIVSVIKKITKASLLMHLVRVVMRAEDVKLMLVVAQFIQRPERLKYLDRTVLREAFTCALHTLNVVYQRCQIRTEHREFFLVLLELVNPGLVSGEAMFNFMADNPLEEHDDARKFVLLLSKMLVQICNEVESLSHNISRIEQVLMKLIEYQEFETLDPLLQKIVKKLTPPLSYDLVKKLLTRALTKTETAGDGLFLFAFHALGLVRTSLTEKEKRTFSSELFGIVISVFIKENNRDKLAKRVELLYQLLANFAGIPCATLRKERLPDPQTTVVTGLDALVAISQDEEKTLFRYNTILVERILQTSVRETETRNFLRNLAATVISRHILPHTQSKQEVKKILHRFIQYYPMCDAYAHACHLVRCDILVQQAIDDMRPIVNEEDFHLDDFYVRGVIPRKNGKSLLTPQRLCTFFKDAIKEKSHFEIRRLVGHFKEICEFLIEEKEYLSLADVCTALFYAIVPHPLYSLVSSAMLPGVNTLWMKYGSKLDKDTEKEIRGMRNFSAIEKFQFFNLHLTTLEIVEKALSGFAGKMNPEDPYLKGIYLAFSHLVFDLITLLERGGKQTEIWTAFMLLLRCKQAVCRTQSARYFDTYKTVIEKARPYFNKQIPIEAFQKAQNFLKECAKNPAGRQQYLQCDRLDFASLFILQHNQSTLLQVISGDIAKNKDSKEKAQYDALLKLLPALS